MLSLCAFCRPVRLSPILAEFMGGETATRGEITKRMHAYFKAGHHLPSAFPGEAHRIRKNHSRCANPESTSKLLAAAAAAQENGLLDPENGQFVIADAKLRAITGQERFKAFSAHPFPVSGPRVELRVRQTVLPCEFLALPMSECLRQRARPPSTPAVQSLLKQHFIKDEEGDDEEEGEGGGEGEEGEGEDGDA